MLAQERDEGKARTLAHRIAMRATRHERAADEEADLRMDLAAIAGDAEELEKALGKIIDPDAIRSAKIATLDPKKLADWNLRSDGRLPEPEPEIGLSWGGASLMDVMEEAVEARERAEEERALKTLYETMFHVVEHAWAVWGSSRRIMYNGPVYLVGVKRMEELGNALAAYRDAFEASPGGQRMREVVGKRP